MILIVDLIVLLITWMPTYPLRLSLAAPDPIGGWVAHIGWLIAFAALWLLLGRLDPELRRRPPSSPAAIVFRLVGPVVLLTLGTQFSYTLGIEQTIHPVLAGLWGVAVLIFMSVARIILAGQDRPPFEPRSTACLLAYWSAASGFVLSALVSLFPDPWAIYTPDLGKYAVATVRGFVRLVSLAGLAILLGIALPRLFIRIRWALMNSPRRVYLGVAAIVAVALPMAFAYFVLDAVPHVQDEISIIFQARNFAAGRLYAPVPDMVEAFDAEYVLIDGDKWYGKYFPGPSLLLMPGVVLERPWAVNPVISAPAMLLLFVLGRRLCGERTGRLAVFLAVLSPFWIMTFGSQMAHAGCLALLLVFSLLLIKGASLEGKWYHGVGAGLAWAASVWFRPYTAAVYGLPWLIYGLIRIIRRRASWTMIPLFGIAAVGGVAPLFLYNKTLTGDPFLAPFTKWSPEDRLGFGTELGMDYWPEGRRWHTPERGLAEMGQQLAALGWELTGWPRGILVLMVIGGLASRRRGPGLLLLAAGVSLPIAYVFYHYGEPCFGPRYYAEALPAYLILIAMALAVVRRRLAGLLASWGLDRPVRYASTSTWALIMLGTLVCCVSVVPATLQEYGYGFGAVDAAVKNTVEEANLKNAVVFVRTIHFRSLEKGQLAPDYYGAAFWMNSPTLDGEVVYARDLDRDLSRDFPPGTNRRLLELFPDRKAYRFEYVDLDKGRLVPLGEGSRDQR